MKKILCLILCLMFAFVMASCVPGDDNTSPIGTGDNVDKGTSILTDKYFRNGFGVRGLGNPIYPAHAEEETYGNDNTGVVTLFQYGKTDLDQPRWNIAQWSTRYAFHNPAITEFRDLGNNTYSYSNPSKLLEVNTKTGEFKLGLKASECYVYGDRVHGQEWPHLLIERYISNQSNPSPHTKVSDKDKIMVSVEARLNSFEDKMSVPANPGLHSAMMMIYLYVSNRNPVSQTYDDMIWFGVMIFDNRWEYSPQMDFVDIGSKDSATGKYIYNLDGSDFLSPGNNFWKDGQIVSGYDSPWVKVNVNVLPYIRTALERAQASDCMLSSSYENLYISGMYIGYELPGTYDIEMSFKNLDIRVFY